MREIIFRGKRTSNGEWVNGNLYTDKYKTEIVKLCVWENYNNREVVCNFPIDKATVGQYIGVKDKDGKQIFEGDIVDCWSQGRHCTNGIVTWVENSIFITIKGKDGRIVDNWHIMPNNNGIDEGLSVIGNIHDNPELIK